MSAESKRLLRYLAGHLAVGTVAAAAVVAALLLTNAAGLADLALADEQAAVAVGLLGFGLWVTFGGLALAAGIMGIGRCRPAGPGGGRRTGWRMPVPVPVRPRCGWRSSR